MATEVSSIMRLMNGRDSSPAGGGGGKSTAGLVTRDLLGGSKELDLDLKVPSGWEKLLDINSGKVYLQRCNGSSSSSSTSERKQTENKLVSKLQDLNYPPVAEKHSKIFNDATLDLKLLPSPSSSNYQSVCTLDKVKSALEKVEKESRKRSVSMTLSKTLSIGSPPSSNSSSSIKNGEIINQEDNNRPSSFATGCPNCLMYVLISKSDPKCPRCNTLVPSPPPIMKRPRIDLNLTI